MSAKLTKEELMEKTNDIENADLKKELSELTEDDLRNVVGGTLDPHGNDSGLDIKCPKCGSHNTQLIWDLYCLDCGEKTRHYDIQF